MANVRHQRPKLKADVDKLFRLYTQNAIVDTKTLKTVFGVSPNTALRAIRLCINDAKEKGIVFYTDANEIPTNYFFNFYGWDISQIETAYNMAKKNTNPIR